MKTLIIDSSALCYQAAFASTMSTLQYNNEYTGVIYGFLRQLLTIGQHFNSNHFVFAWDGSRKDCKRTAVYPNYKNRTKERTEAEKQKWEVCYKQFSLLRDKIIPSLGFTNNFYCPGFEADDIIAKIVGSYYQEEWGGFTILSSDEDLYQLLADCDMFLLSKKVNYTRDDFVTQYKIEPYDWAQVKAIAGCTSDKVAGITGVGVATAIKYLRGELKEETKAYQSIINGKATIHTNLQLVALPHRQTPPITLNEFKPLCYSDWVSVFQEYHFKSFLDGKHYEELRKLILLRVVK